VTLFRSVSQLDWKSKNMADIQLVQWKNQQKTSSNHRNIVPYKEIGVKELNASVRIFTGSS